METWQHDRPIVGVLRRLVERAGVLVRPVHADGELGEGARVERVQDRVDVAERVDLVLARLLRPARARRSEERHSAGTLLISPLQPAVCGRVLRDVPVHAQDLVVARPVLHRLEGVVVLIRAGGVRGIRQREQIQERLPDRIEPARRDPVPRETRRSARHAVARAGEERIANEDQTSLAVERL